MGKQLRSGSMSQRWLVKMPQDTVDYRLSTQELEDVKGGRGKAHLVVKCRLCGRENNLRESQVQYFLTILYESSCIPSEILEDLVRPYSVSSEKTTP